MGNQWEVYSRFLNWNERKEINIISIKISIKIISIKISIEYIIEMNYLSLLPDDVMEIINRKVQDWQIIKRRTERKQNKRIQGEKTNSR